MPCRSWMGGVGHHGPGRAGCLTLLCIPYSSFVRPKLGRRRGLHGSIWTVRIWSRSVGSSDCQADIRQRRTLQSTRNAALLSWASCSGAFSSEDKLRTGRITFLTCQDDRRVDWPWFREHLLKTPFGWPGFLQICCFVLQLGIRR